MRNIVPARTLERRSRRLLVGALLFALFGLFVASIGFFLFAIELVVPSNPDFGVYDAVRRVIVGLGVLIIFTAIALVIRAVTWRMDNKLAEKTADALQEFLDDDYVFIRNVSKLKLGYIDAVLVGRNGVLVFRITDRVGTFFNDKGHWLRQRDRGDWQTMRWNPTREVVADVDSLRQYLADKDLPDVPIFAVIVFLNDRPLTQISAQEPVVRAMYAHELAYELNDTYFARQRIDQATVRRIVHILMN